MIFWVNKIQQQGYYWPRAYRPVRPPPDAVLIYLDRPQIIRPRGSHPKPMVTPVRRFQSLESVSNNGLRHSRHSPGHRPNRPLVHSNGNIRFNNNASTLGMPRLGRDRSIDTDNQQTSPRTLQNNELEPYIRKCKFLLLAFTFFTVFVTFGANYLRNTGQLWRLNTETVIIISVALVVLLLGGIVLLCLGEARNTNAATSNQRHSEHSNDQLQLDELQQSLPEQQRPTHLPIPQTDIRDMSPPPYHIAIRLASQNDLEEIRIYDEQSPPPYEKAVT